MCALNARDQEWLDRIEAALQREQGGDRDAVDPGAFCARLARLIPEVEATFRQDLAERLLALMEPQHTRVRYVDIELPIGRWYLAFNPRGVCCVAPAANDPEFEGLCARRFGRQVWRSASPPHTVRGAIQGLVEGAGCADVPVDLEGLSCFTRAVLNKAREIPRGQVRSYAWVAREIGHPRAVRAVGTALGANPVPLVIPCHRVVRSDGSLGGYAWGLERKRALLAWEGAL